MPDMKNQCIKGEERHDWRDMGKAINDTDYWRCKYCGKSPLLTKGGYPPQANCNCLARNNCKHIWVRFNTTSSDNKKWKCQKCSKNPHSIDKLLEKKGIPSPSGGWSAGCNGNKSNGAEHFHVWEYIGKK